MSLFGRRKPGFAKEVVLKPEDISGEFSDRNDPARQDANPKDEKVDMAARAQAVIDGTAVSAAEAAPKADAAPDLAEQAAQEGRTVDLFEYMDSLPDVEDPFPPSEPEPEPELLPEKKPGELLADYIRERTRCVQLTPRKPLQAEEPLLDEMLEEMHSLESCQDIRSVVGQKDEYFYSDEIMANNYAMIAMLVYEKDLPRTIAQMVRFNCKTYPAPTPVDYFKRNPFSYTKPQLDHALRMIEKDEAYQDIKVVEAFNGVPYLYAEGVMSRKYAKALADDSETSEGDRR